MSLAIYFWPELGEYRLIYASQSCLWSKLPTRQSSPWPVSSCTAALPSCHQIPVNSRSKAIPSTISTPKLISPTIVCVSPGAIILPIYFLPIKLIKMGMFAISLIQCRRSFSISLRIIYSSLRNLPKPQLLNLKQCKAQWPML